MHLFILPMPPNLNRNRVANPVAAHHQKRAWYKDADSWAVAYRHPTVPAAAWRRVRLWATLVMPNGMDPKSGRCRRSCAGIPHRAPSRRVTHRRDASGWRQMWRHRVHRGGVRSAGRSGEVVMRRAHAHTDEASARRRPAAEQVDGLPMFVAPSVGVSSSEAAAESVRGHVRAAHDIILALLLVHERLTCEEVRDRTGWSGDYARPRLWELEGMQQVRKCDGSRGADAVQRRTRTGRLAVCYELTTRGRQMAEDAGALAARRLGRERGAP